LKRLLSKERRETRPIFIKEMKKRKKTTTPPATRKKGGGAGLRFSSFFFRRKPSPREGRREEGKIPSLPSIKFLPIRGGKKKKNESPSWI